MKKEEVQKINLDEWVMVTPFGPMLHRDTGETYQGMNARLEFEHQKNQRQVRD